MKRAKLFFLVALASVVYNLNVAILMCTSSRTSLYCQCECERGQNWSWFWFPDLKVSSVSPQTNTIASRDQFKPIRIGENLVADYINREPNSSYFTVKNNMDYFLFALINKGSSKYMCIVKLKSTPTKQLSEKQLDCLLFN